MTCCLIAQCVGLSMGGCILVVTCCCIPCDCCSNKHIDDIRIAPTPATPAISNTLAFDVTYPEPPTPQPPFVIDNPDGTVCLGVNQPKLAQESQESQESHV